MVNSAVICLSLWGYRKSFSFWFRSLGSSAVVLLQQQGFYVSSNSVAEKMLVMAAVG